MCFNFVFLTILKIYRAYRHNVQTLSVLKTSHDYHVHVFFLCDFIDVTLVITDIIRPKEILCDHRTFQKYEMFPKIGFVLEISKLGVEKYC